MRLFSRDSRMRPTELGKRAATGLATIGLATSCVSQQVDVTQLDVAATPQVPAVVSAFRSLCMARATMPDDVFERALNAGWSDARDEDLAAAGLEGLRKQVLEIPGGGAEVSEEQKLLAREFDGETTILAAELKRARNAVRATNCSIYQRAAFLPTCEAVGKKIGRAPDHNQKYGEGEAHFIRWRVMLDEQPAVVSCEYAPGSRTLPYDGTVLSLRVDYSTPRNRGASGEKPSAARRD